MNYNWSQTYNDAFLRLQPKETLQLKKVDGRVEVIKNRSKPRKEYHLNPTNLQSGYITADKVHIQLDNIKHIGFEVTDACNLKCTYCAYGEFYNDYDNRVNKQIDSRRAKVLINFLVGKLNSTYNNSPQNEVVISFYGGEPLLNIRFIKEIVTYTQLIQEDHLKFRYSMTTNAIYLKKHISFLSQYDFTILISLDGSEENDGHRLFHDGKPSFEAVYSNIKYVREYYPTYFTRKIRFNAVVHNLNNAQEVILFFQREFDKIPHLSRVNPTGVKPELEKAFEHLARPKTFAKDEKLQAEIEQVLDLASPQVKQLQKFIFRYSGNVYDNYNDLLIKKRSTIRFLPSATCMPFSKRIFMTVNNKILPCEKIGHQYSLGEVTDDGVKIDCDQIAEKYNGYYDSLKSQCVGCYNRKHCSKCMYDIKNLNENPICDEVANSQMFNDYIKENIDKLSHKPELYKRIMEEIMVIK